MKRLIFLILALGLLIAGLPPVWAEGETAVWKQFTVSVTGDDGGDGVTVPFRTIARAQEAVRNCSADMRGDIVVSVEQGTYFLEDTLRFRSDDSGKNGYRVIYRGEGRPVLSGGRQAPRFTQSQRYPQLWQTEVDGVESIRELYVNGRKAEMAGSERCMTGIDFFDDPATDYECDGMYLSADDIGCYERPEDIEFHWAVTWKHATAKVESIEPDPQNDRRMIVRMQQSWWNNVAGRKVDSDLGPKPYRPFTIKNAFELLDKPGEFYYDKEAKTVYYMPREGESIESADGIVPRLDKLVILNGADIGDKVKNISFEGFTFAHAAFDAMSEGGVMTGQAQFFVASNGLPTKIPGALELRRTDGIAFRDNVFFGLGGAGLSLETAVENTDITGNTFADIGDAAVFVGWWDQGDGTYQNGTSPAPPENAEANILYRNKVYASYYGIDNDKAMELLMSEEPYVLPDGFRPGKTWYADPHAQEAGERQWIKYDFDDSYCVNSIKLAFDTGATTPEERSGFEVLLSNDKSFSVYDTVAVQTEPAGRTVEYKPPKEKKYRYLMVRTLEPKRFAISGICATTRDIKPYTAVQRTRNNTIANNYITRSGSSVFSGGGISAFYADGLHIVHNEISDIPYSGIMLGWGWNSQNTGSANHLIEANDIHDVTTLLQDGGGVYTLSDLKGSVFQRNYLHGIGIGYGALYTDEGTARGTWRDNVVTDAWSSYFVPRDTMINNEFHALYSSADNAIYNAGSRNLYQSISVFEPGDPCAEAYEIIRDAGLEPQFRYLRELAPEGEVDAPDRHASFELKPERAAELLSQLSGQVDRVLAADNFGSLPGQYPYQSKLDLLEARAMMMNVEDANRIETVIRVRDIVSELQITRLEPEEMLMLCRRSSAEADTNKVLGGYPAAAVAEFRDRIDAAEKIFREQDGSDYQLVKSLEQAYRAFENARYSAGIDGANADGARFISIDQEKRTVTLSFPKNAKKNGLSLEIVPYGSGIAAAALDDVDLSRPVTVPVYCKGAGQYAFWTISAVFGEEPQENDWFSADKDSVTRTNDGAVWLSPAAEPCMSLVPAEDGVRREFAITPVSAVDSASFRIIFGAARARGFQLESTRAADDHYELAVEDRTASLVLVRSGERTKLGAWRIEIRYNKENTFAVTLNQAGNGSRVRLTWNGAPLADVLSPQPFYGGYAGVCSETAGIRLG